MHLQICIYIYWIEFSDKNDLKLNYEMQCLEQSAAEGKQSKQRTIYPGCCQAGLQKNDDLYSLKVFNNFLKKKKNVKNISSQEI